MRWSRPATPVYDLGYERISRPILLPDGVVFLDGANLMKVNREGKLFWRRRHLDKRISIRVPAEIKEEGECYYHKNYLQTQRVRNLTYEKVIRYSKTILIFFYACNYLDYVN